jgi:hypothetical protein
MDWFIPFPRKLFPGSRVPPVQGKSYITSGERYVCTRKINDLRQVQEDSFKAHPIFVELSISKTFKPYQLMRHT